MAELLLGLVGRDRGTKHGDASGPGGLKEGGYRAACCLIWDGCQAEMGFPDATRVGVSPIQRAGALGGKVPAPLPSQGLGYVSFQTGFLHQDEAEPLS